jgi:hypothetical protein
MFYYFLTLFSIQWMYEGRLCRSELYYDVYAVRKVIAAVSGFFQCSGSKCFWASWICIRIRKLFVRIQILPSQASTSKKNEEKLWFYCFVTSLWIFIFEESCKKYLQKGLGISINKNYFFGILKVTDLRAGSRAWSASGYVPVPKCHGSGRMVFSNQFHRITCVHCFGSALVSMRIRI